MQKRKGPISIADIAARTPKKQPQSNPVAAPSTWSAKDAYKFITEQQGPQSDSNENSATPTRLAPIENPQMPEYGVPKPQVEVPVAQIGVTDQEFEDSLTKKLGTKWEQSSNKVGTSNPEKQQQSGNKVATKWEQSLPKNPLSGNKVGAQLGTQVGTKWEQSSNKVGTNRDVSTLIGLQHCILVCLYESCLRARAHHTERLPIEKISQSSGTSVQSAKVTIRRLEKIMMIKRLEYKDGRGGWTVYELPNHVHSYLRLDETRNKVGTKWEQTRNKVGAQPGTQLGTSPSSSSRDLFFKEESTTTTQTDSISRIDLSCVQHLGITTSVLARCIELYPIVKVEQLEVLAYRFAEFMKDPKNKVQNARGFFISLAKQVSEGQVPLDHIETPDERLMRLFLERQKEAKARRVDVERAAQEFECEAWLETLTPEMKLTIIPETSLLKSGTAAHQAMLKQHFAESVWPERRQKILEQGANP